MTEHVPDERPMRYIEGDKVIYRASSLGYCHRAFVALSNGMTPTDAPAWLKKAWKEGTESEPFIIEQYLEKYQATLVETQSLVELPIGENIIIRGHIDFQANEDGSLYIGEAKKVSDSHWTQAVRKKVEDNVLYPWQLSVYMHATELPAVFVQGRYEQGLLHGEIQEVERHVYLDPPIPLKAIVDRVLSIEADIGQGTYPTDIECNPVIYPCLWFYLHDEDAPEPPARLPLDESLTEHVAALHKATERATILSAETRKLDKEKKEHSTPIKEWMDKNGLGGETDFEASYMDGDREVKVVVHRNKYSRKGYEVKETEVDTIQVKEQK